MSAAELYSFLLYFLQIFKQDIVPALYDFAIFKQVNMAVILVALNEYTARQILPHEVVRVVYGLHGGGQHKQHAAVLLCCSAYALALGAVVPE